MTARALPTTPRWGVAWRWASEHLFASRRDAAITVVTLTLGALVVSGAARWAVSSADWAVVQTNVHLLLVGRFPNGEEWRLWLPALTVTSLAATSWGAWRRPSPRALVLVGAGAGLLLLGSGEGARLWVSLGVVLGVAGLVVGRTSTGAPALRTPLRRVVIAGWLAVCPLAILLLVAFGGVEVGRWGGLYLNYLITATAALGAFPIGVLMALGRRSGYRVIRMSCTTMMDATRSLPLIVVLLVSALAIQRLLPTLWGINEAGLFIRILAAYTLFTSVYVAVCVSGGLAGLPRGQSEAALALGLTPTQVNRSVLLPQGIRRAIPSLTGELIDLLMASTLISVLGMTDILAAARATTEQPAFFGRQKEVLLVVGVVFWATAFSLSRLGRAAERALAPRSGREGTAQR